MLWHPLASQSDLDGLMHLFGGFHDGCLREAHLWTEHFVFPDLHMRCNGDLDTRIRVLFQRQFHSPSAIELLFEQVVTFHLKPSPPNYDSILMDAALLLVDGVFYWADCCDWSPDSARRDEHTWIAARALSWRDASEWMGETLRYAPQAAET